MANIVKKISFNGFDNTFSIAVKLKGEYLDLTPASGFELRAGSEIISDGITGDEDGLITFNLGNSGLPKGIYDCVLIVFDGLHPNGQILCHPRAENQLRLEVASLS